MSVSSPETSAALLARLKALRGKHLDFQTRVKTANQASRARSEETREQNKSLAQRIGGLEDELKQAQDSIEALYAGLFPAFKNEIDPLEDDVDVLEAHGSDTSGLEHIMTATAISRVDSLENGNSDIIEPHSPSFSDVSDLFEGTEDSFSVVDGSSNGSVRAGPSILATTGSPSTTTHKFDKGISIVQSLPKDGPIQLTQDDQGSPQRR